MAATTVTTDVTNLTPEDIAFTNAPTLMSQSGTIFAFSAAIVLLRMYVRLAMLKAFGKDDWFMLIAMIMSTTTFVAYALQVNFGLGKHIAVIQMDKASHRSFLRLRQVHQITVGIGLTMVKISICFFLLRLVTRKAYTWFLRGLIVFLVLFVVACTGTLVCRKPQHAICIQIFQCVPVKAAWDTRLRPPPLGTGTAQCFTPQTFTQIGLFNTVINIATDFILALLPVPLIWQLQINLRTRVSLIFVLSLGLLAAVAGIIKSVKQLNFLSSPDRYVHDTFMIWMLAEFNLGIIASSLPTLRPLFGRFLDAARGIKSAPTDGSGFHEPNAQGYHKQDDESHRSIPLKNYKGRTEVRISSNLPPDKAHRDVWGNEQAKNSDDSILPLHDIEDRSNGIVVTRQVRVD
ncbi:hypothetical protein P153DRAFT_384158 [Dothidotthia symphoricarpi CBS 119687]|uniref:Rhodopsin domain-containing protein n=1 Tax=Dothidotthia symphoricarpi CBS 119687 TaxID=1392245 RepID=A0A6A6AI81_9PLEO|nr:uncharacterized protein P153DRAFT_384158 [Dothidotthia symphoricarpi CBS 119687]KAF2130943.1 hypothetical protein P153DRAFT_384158 [Dothidotthia symphoricarpi CBS 119687]